MGEVDKEILDDSLGDVLNGGFVSRFLRRYPTPILEALLACRTTGRNIIWADNEYECLGTGYAGCDEITVEKITGSAAGTIKPRIAKAAAHQSARTKTRAEVFTPSWLVNRMNNYIDCAWFGRRDVFNVEDFAVCGRDTLRGLRGAVPSDCSTPINAAATTHSETKHIETSNGAGGCGWVATTEKVPFSRKKGCTWRDYVHAKKLEITCGEAPFVCSRYDTVTGDVLPLPARVGFLDRKLRVVTENANSRKIWVEEALNALKATYAYEYQGDNLLIARINVFETFAEHMFARWGKPASPEVMQKAAWIISWNIWQMNGLNCAVPADAPDAEVESALGGFAPAAPAPVQTTIFDLLAEDGEDDAHAVEAVCDFATLRGLRGAVPSDHSTPINAGEVAHISTESVSTNTSVHPPRHSEQFFAAGEKCEESHTAASDLCAHAQKSRKRVSLCVIYDWENDKPFEFASLKGKVNVMASRERERERVRAVPNSMRL